MIIRYMALLSAAAVLAACSGATDTVKTETAEAGKAVSQVAAKVMDDATPKGADLSALPAGTYKSEQGHAYIAFQYSHHGFSKPIIRWGTTDATVVFDADNPEKSTLTVRLPTADIDTGVPIWDDHIKAEGFFDVENYPEITFVSTDISQIKDGYGTLTGNLTIKDVTKPFTLTGTVNKVGKGFQTGVDMFGVSATGTLNRSEFGVDKYAPAAEEIEITVEIEFQKAE